MATSESAYRFVKVEDYFAGYRSWQTAGMVEKIVFEPKNKALALSVPREDGGHATLLIQIAAQNTVRLRFAPAKTNAAAFTDNNSRSLIMDKFQDLVNTMETFSLKWDEKQNELAVRDETGEIVMSVVINRSPFILRVIKHQNGNAYEMLSTDKIYFSPNGESDYNIIHTFQKPACAKYIGFGEHGGVELAKNSSQINFFNFDNMRYRQVYDRGPFECREPLYHSDPFFMQFNTWPNEDAVGGFFVDNPSQILMDMGYLNAGRIMIGTRFWDSDIFFIAGDNAADVMTTFMSFIGTPKLKPRYALGYHQGCYGYETREDVENAAEEYRKYRIPLDGIHIDVDIQSQYQTFTIDESKFPNPQEMFRNLAQKGIKCSTNITPVISNRDPYYKTYADGKEHGYFLNDVRTHHDDAHAHMSQDFGGGMEYYQWTDDHEGNYNSGKPYIGEVYYGGDRGTSGHYANLNRKDVRKWWGRQYEYLYNCGLEMVWQDMTTPCIRSTRGDMRGLPFRMLVTQDYYSGQEEFNDVEAIKVWNLYSYNLHKATYHGLNHLPGRENKRNFIVGRGSFTGMHRFAALWTGDNSSNWDFLKINVAQILSLGMSGQAMGGQDIGGFEREHDWEKWADPELLIRWTAAGAFMPWFRNHYIGAKKDVKLFQEPHAYQHVDLDAWQVPQEERYLYHSVLPVCKYYIELRYRLMQLFYDALFENTLNGMPICRPMFLCCGADKALYNDKLEFLSNQFFVRNDLLVAPVLDKQSPENGGGQRNVYLPSGTEWYDYVDNKAPLLPAVEGGTTIRYDAHISSDPAHIPFILPVYVRAGAIIPSIGVEQYIGEYNQMGLPNPITLSIYPGLSGEYTMYLDDGVSRSSAAVSPADHAAKGEYRAVQITHQVRIINDEKIRDIKIERIHDNYTPQYEKFFYLAILHAPDEIDGSVIPVTTVLLDGTRLQYLYDYTPENAAKLLEESQTNSWYYHYGLRITFIKIFDNSAAKEIRLVYSKG